MRLAGIDTACFVDPFPPHHQFVAEIAEMGDWPAPSLRKTRTAPGRLEKSEQSLATIARKVAFAFRLLAQEKAEQIEDPADGGD